MTLTDGNQTELRIAFGRLLERYAEVYPHVTELEDLAANGDEDAPPRFGEMVDESELIAWKRENAEVATEIRDLYGEFDEMLSSIGVESADPVSDRDEVERVIGADLTDMYRDLLVSSAFVHWADRGGGASDTDSGLLSGVRSKLTR
ncbi:hypothetical protein [Halobellus salinus]|uniref:hypothetical protein n=1 Tax=Halobellus salinus TaxID=931585 RepID=UPI00166B2F8D|nr:hypothetical protein [Halobellus salinus]